MNRHRLALSIALGVAAALGLLFGLDTDATAAEAAPPAPSIDHSEVISEALTYLQARLLPDGSIESDWAPGTSDDFTTIKTVLALAAAGRPISHMTSISDNTPLDYLASRTYTYTRDVTGTVFPGRAGMMIAATAAGNGNPYALSEYPAGHSAAGTPIDLVKELQATYHPATGAYSTTAQGAFTSGDANTTNQLWALVGLASVQESAPISATDFFISLQESDGGWAWVTGSGGDADMTGLAIQALLASGNLEPTDVEIQEGLAFLRERQLPSGGWAGYYGNLSADSTAAALQAIAAAGYTPATMSWATGNGRTPHDELAALQDDNGSFGDNALATAHAIAGLLEAPVPVLGRAQRANRALTWMNEQQNTDGSWSGWAGPDPGATCDAALAYAAAGFDPDSVTAPGSSISAMDYLSASASTFVNKSADSAGKLALVVEAAGADARDFGGVDIVDVLANTWYSPTTGAFGDASNSWHQAFSMLGLAAAEEPIPASAIQTLTGLQGADGSWTDAWGFDRSGSTGLAIQALLAAGVPVTDSSVVSGTISLWDQRDAEGSWGNANATAYAIQGLVAAGEDLVVDWSTEAGHSPYEALAAYQKSDGPFVYMWDSPWGAPDDSGLATWQAVPALLGVHYPFSQTLTSFVAVNRGPDPDRTVAADLHAEWGDSLDVVIPFGSDLDADGDVTLTWREVGSTSWETGTVHRTDGHYTATLGLTLPGAYELRATFADPDSVQYGTVLSDTVSSITTFARYDIFLPFVLRQ
jgi:hypothetical protein